MIAICLALACAVLLAVAVCQLYRHAGGEDGFRTGARQILGFFVAALAAFIVFDFLAGTMYFFYFVLLSCIAVGAPVVVHQIFWPPEPAAS